MSKIPEGATHTTVSGGYIKFENSLWYVYCDGYWYRARGETINGLGPPTRIQAEPEWTGGGRPPVGTACEAKIYDGRGDLIWKEVRVIHHHPRFPDSAAITHGNGELLGWAGEFRKTKTPEQIAAEKRDAAIKMIESRVNVVRLVAERIYDSGLRFEGVEK